MDGPRLMSSSPLKPTENPRKTSDFLIGCVKKFAGNVVIVAICAEETRSPNNVIWRKSIRFKPFKSVIISIYFRFPSVPVRYGNASIFFFVSPKIDRKSLKNRQFSFCTFSPLSVSCTFPSSNYSFLRIKKGLKALSYLKSLFLSLFTCEFLGDFSPVLVGRKSTHFSLISELSSSIKVLISLNWR